MVLEKYNSMTETNYLNTNSANYQNLEEDMAQVRVGKTISKTIEELCRYQ